MIYRFVILMLLVLINSSHLYAQARSEPVRTEHATAELRTQSEHIQPDTPFWVALKLSLDPHWHSYWQNPGDSGYPTELVLELPEGYAVGEQQWQVPKRFMMSGITNYGYADEAWHFLRVTPPSEITAPLALRAKARWLICKDICIPESAELSLELTPSDVPMVSNAAFKEQRAKVPQLLGEVTARYHVHDTTIALALPKEVPLEGNPERWRFFPVDNNIISNEVEGVLRGAGEPSDHGVWMFDASHAASEAGRWRLVVADAKGHAYQLDIVPDASLAVAKAAANDGGLALGWALALAFLGGLILNLMPCVLPVLSLKAFSLIHHNCDERRVTVMHGVSYTAGVLVSFLLIAAALILLQRSGAEIGWGFQLQSPLFVFFLAWLMMMVGFNLSGLYELPVLSFGGEHASGDSYAASAITGVLAVLVATPCTAPYMAPAIGFALTQPPIIQLAIFLALGLGMAAPFLLMSLLPVCVRYLPKPGAWMLRFKEFLAFPMYATGAWLVWVLAKQVGSDALPWLFFSILMAALLLWWRHKPEAGFVRRFGSIIMIFGFLALGMFGIAGSQQRQSLAERTQPYDAELLQLARDEGQPIFVYATADWCITCKINERTTLYSEAVIDHFAEHNIHVFRADWTDYDAEITRYLKQFERAGVPIYVYYAPGKEPELLPQLLTPSIVIDAVGGEVR